MNNNEYLSNILKSQDLDPAGDEYAAMNTHAKAIENLLRDRYGQAPVRIVGGSIAKGTVNREYFDYDLHFYFANEDTQAGSTLQEIFDDMVAVLETAYKTEPKRSAIRLQTRNEDGTFSDLFFDVVPGRFINGSSGDVFLNQNEGDKARLQTNIEKQIAWVRNSGVVPVIRLIKLWKVRCELMAKTFVLELLVIEILKDKALLSLDQQFVHVPRNICRWLRRNFYSRPHQSDWQRPLHHLWRRHQNRIAGRSRQDTRSNS